MSEFGFSEKQATALRELLYPTALQAAAVRNLLVAKGLIDEQEIASEIDRLDKAALFEATRAGPQTAFRAVTGSSAS